MAQVLDREQVGSAAATPPAAAPPSPGGKQKRVFGILLVVLLVVGAASTFFYARGAGTESTDDAQIDAHITPISARVGGTVLAVRVDDNQQVKAGDVLVEIDPRDYQVLVDRAAADLSDAEAAAISAGSEVPVTSTSARSVLSNAEASLNEMRASYEAARTGIDSAQARLNSAQAKVREAKANYDRASKDLERYKTLVDKDEVSRQQYDTAAASTLAYAASLEASQADVAAATQAIAEAKATTAQAQARIVAGQARVEQYGTVKQQVASVTARARSAEAKVQQAKAALGQARLNLSYTTLHAPVSGVVGRKAVEIGQSIGAGQQLMNVVPLDALYVTANFKETQLRQMRVGQPVEIRVDTMGGGRTFQGHIDSLAPATGSRFSLLPPENATGNYVKVVQRLPVKIALDPGQDPTHLLRPGLSVIPTVRVR